MIDHEPIEINLENCQNNWECVCIENLHTEIIKRKLDPSRIPIEDWVKQINNQECNKLIMKDKVTLYTYEIDIDTLVTQANETEEDEYDEEFAGYAEFEESLEGRRVYAESLISVEDARQLVLDYCNKFMIAGAHIMMEIHGGNK